MFQTDGPAKEKDLSPNVFVFTRGVTKVRVSDADRNCLAGVYGGRRSARYSGAVPEMELKQLKFCIECNVLLVANA